MWFDGQRQPNTLYVANTSRGKDSTAMLRAIQLMGWPLDMICSVDIWFDEDTPAELPQMVKFKDEYDAKILEWFGIPVTRLCATKRERQKQTESVTHSGSHTAECSTTGCHQEADLKERSEDSRCAEKAGARNLRRTKLTYCDIFYRQLKPREREREREGAAQSEDSRLSVEHGATAISNGANYRIPVYRRCWSRNGMVYRRTQEDRITGFPISVNRGNWCTRLKQIPNQGLSAIAPTRRIVVSRPTQGFQRKSRSDRPNISPCRARERRAEDKYRSLYRHRLR